MRARARHWGAALAHGARCRQPRGALGERGTCDTGAGRRALGARGAGVRPGRTWARRLGCGRCTWCTQPIFDPVLLSTVPESIYGHCS